MVDVAEEAVVVVALATIVVVMGMPNVHVVVDVVPVHPAIRVMRVAEATIVGHAAVATPQALDPVSGLTPDLARVLSLALVHETQMMMGIMSRGVAVGTLPRQVPPLYPAVESCSLEIRHDIQLLVCHRH